MNDKCGDRDCPGGHDDLRTQHCNRDQLVKPAPVVQIVYAEKRNENCPKCGHRSFFRVCKCGGVLW